MSWKTIIIHTNTISEVVERRLRMAKSKAKESQRTIRPASTPEARENQLISLAVGLAEKQLLEGTASSQVISHYLKLGSTREKLDYEYKQTQMELMKAKTAALESSQIVEELYVNAISAMRKYSGSLTTEDSDDD